MSSIGSQRIYLSNQKVVFVLTTFCDNITDFLLSKFLIVTEKITSNRSDQGSLLCSMPQQNPLQIFPVHQRFHKLLQGP